MKPLCPTPLNQLAGNLAGNCLFACLKWTTQPVNNRDITSKADNETREGRKTCRKYKISDDCWLFAGDVAADGAKTAAEAEDEREQSSCLMIVLALVSWPSHQCLFVVEQ